MSPTPDEFSNQRRLVDIVVTLFTENRKGLNPDRQGTKLCLGFFSHGAILTQEIILELLGTISKTANHSVITLDQIRLFNNTTQILVGIHPSVRVYNINLVFHHQVDFKPLYKRRLS